jgi:hypothetical protein
LCEFAENRQSIVPPAADSTVAEVSGGFAMAEIIETQKSPAVFCRPLIERRGFGPLHIGMEAAQPDHSGSLSGALQIGDCLAIMPLECLHLPFPRAANVGREFRLWT